MQVRKYIEDLTVGGLFVAESRVVAGTLIQRLSDEEWKLLIVEKNVLQKRSPHTSLRYARAIKRRLAPLGDQFIRDLLEASEPAYVQMLMVALIIHSPVLPDFMLNVVAEARRVYKLELSKTVWDDFMDDRVRTVEGLSKLSASTLSKAGTNVVRVLVEAGYLNNNRDRELQPVYLLPDVRCWLTQLNRQDLVAVMECTL